MLHRLTVYNNVGLTSKASQEGEKVSTTPLLFDTPSPGKPREYPHEPYIARN